MANITFKGDPVNILGDLPERDRTAPEFSLTRNDLTDVSLREYPGKRKVLNIFPSLETSTCALSVKRFNKEAADLPNTVVLNISMDLPFAMQRFCIAEEIKNSETLSAFRSNFIRDYGLQIIDSPLAGLAARAVVVLGENNRVLYSEQVQEISREPNYEAALEVLKQD